MSKIMYMDTQYSGITSDDSDIEITVSLIAPTPPIGLWFDLTTNSTKYWNGAEWVVFNAVWN